MSTTLEGIAETRGEFIRNQLTIISLAVDMLKLSAGDTPQLDRCTERIDTAIRSLTNLSRDLEE